MKDVAVNPTNTRAESARRIFVCGRDTGVTRAPLIATLQGRELIIAEPTTRAIAHAAISADVAIVVADAREGFVGETRRQAFLVALFGVPRIVLAVDGIEEASLSAFTAIEAEYRAFAQKIGIRNALAVPISIARGDNVIAPSAAAERYRGPTLAAAIDRVDVRASDDAPVEVADQFEASIAWLDKAPLLRGRSYRIELGNTTAGATITPIKYRINVDSLEHVAADILAHDEIGVVDLATDRPLAFKPYAIDRALGGFALIDPMSGETVGIGQLRFALRRSHNIHPQVIDVDRRSRASIKSQRPCVLWFTGLSGAGKSTIANRLETTLHALGRHTYLLDGDNVRKGLNKDLGFTAEDRVENIRRVAEVAALMADAGLIVITAFISPFRNERRMARALMADGEFLEIFVDTPLEVAERRDAKGLYRKARRGELANFTGIDSPYEAPHDAEITIDGARVEPQAAADRIVDELLRRGIIGR